VGERADGSLIVWDGPSLPVIRGAVPPLLRLSALVQRGIVCSMALSFLYMVVWVRLARPR